MRGGKSGVFQVDGGVTAALSGLTITGGSAAVGGGLVNLGTITLTDCTISGNSAIRRYDGGGLEQLAQYGGGFSSDSPTARSAATPPQESAAACGN